MRKLTAPLGAFFALLAFVVATLAPASAANRITHDFGINPTPDLFNLQARYDRVGNGTFWSNFFGASGQTYWSNLAVTPSGGLYVQVAPAITNTAGAVYGIAVDDANVFGNGADSLAADPTLVYIQGLLTTPAIAIGPLTPPATAGQSYDFIIECQPQTVDATPTTFNVVNPNNQVTTSTYNRDRNDIVFCQSKQGAGASIPTPPTTDSGFVAIATVKSTSGVPTISTGNITMNTATGFYGSVLATASGTLPIAELPHGDYVDTANTQTVAGAKTFTGVMTLSSGVQDNGGLYVGPTSTATSGTNYPSNGIVLQDSYYASGAAQTVNATIQSFTSGGVTNYNFSGYNGLTTLTASNGFLTTASAYASSYASIVGTLMVSGATALNGIYNTCGTSAGNCVISVPGTGSLYLNYPSGGSVIIGNGQGAASGTQFNTNGSATVGTNLAIGTTVTAGGGYSVPFDSSGAPQTSVHMIHSNGGTQNQGNGIPANGTYDAPFPSGQYFTNGGTFGCGLAYTSVSGTRPTSGGAPSIQGYDTDGSGHVTGLQLENNANATLGISFFCEGY